MNSPFSTITTRVLSRFSITAFALALIGCPDEKETPSGGTEGEDSLCKQCRDQYGNNVSPLPIARRSSTRS